MSKSNTYWPLVIGAAAGLGLGLLINSENGKKIQKKVGKKLSKMEDRIEKKVSEVVDTAKHNVNNAATKVAKATE